MAPLLEPILKSKFAAPTPFIIPTPLEARLISLRSIVPVLAGLALILAVPWPQWTLWSTQCPGIWCFEENITLLRPLLIEVAICVVVVGAGVFFSGDSRPFESYIGRLKTQRIAATAAIVAFGIALPLLTAWYILDRFPNSGDEYSYIFQARTYAGLKLWESSPRLGVDVIPYRTWILGEKWIGQYPPGWPSVISLGLLVGFPDWAVNPVVGGASVAALAIFCARIADAPAAVLAATFYALTPFYVLNAASYFSHVLCALLILILCIVLYARPGEHKSSGIVAAGAIIGVLGATRYFDLVALVPAVAFALGKQPLREWPRLILWMLVGFAPIVCLLMCYQYWLTGNPFATSYSVIDQDEIFPSLSFHNLTRGWNVSKVNLEEMAIWASPLLMLTYVLCFAAKVKNWKLEYYDLIFPGFFVVYLTFPDPGGNRYGPRYFFEAFPTIIATIVSAVPSLQALLPKRIRYTTVLYSVICAFLYLVVLWPLAALNVHRQVLNCEEPYRLAKAGGLDNVIVIISSPSAIGLRLEDLVRNPPSMDAPVLYARASADPSALRRAYPGRSIWRYSRGDPKLPGVLKRSAIEGPAAAHSD